MECHYCYITQLGYTHNALPQFRFSPDVVKKALSKERMGGTCLINICGQGETLLPPQMTDYIRVLLENGHYVMVVTNGTVKKRFEELTQLPKELLKRLFFKFSYHYLELKRKNLFDLFFNNIRLMRDAGCSFTLEITPNDESIPYIEEIKAIALQEVGALCHVTIAREESDPAIPILTKLPHEEYYKIWGQFKSEMMDFKKTTFYVKRKEFCYAGDWSFIVNLGTGVMTQCYRSHYSQQIFEHPEKPINFVPIGCHCVDPHCFNSHAFLALGAIPELECTTYAAIRNRVTTDGREWLNPEFKAFTSQKLKDANREYTAAEKLAFECRYQLSKLPAKLIRLVKPQS